MRTVPEVLGGCPFDVSQPTTPGKVVLVPHLHPGPPCSGATGLCLGVPAGREIGQPHDIPADRRNAEQRDLATNMKVYNASIHYHLVQEGPAEAVNRPEKIVEYMAGAFDEAPTQEAFYVICLNRKNRPMGRHRITLGTATSCLAHPREIFRVAVLASASAIVCVHNHPSGDPGPSAADVAITRQIRDAAKVMDIELLDHVIVGAKEDDPQMRGYFSFREAGIL